MRGLAAIAAGPVDPPSDGSARIGVAGFPNDEARVFAVRFVGAYLDPSARAEAARFFADDLSDRAAARLPRGPGAEVASAMVAREVSLGGSRALVTVAAFTRDGGIRYVSVPVARDRHGGLVVSDLPSFSPPPPRGAVDGEDIEPLAGPGADAIGDLVRRFLRMYLAGADRTALVYLLLPGAAIAPMEPGLRVVSIDALDQESSAAARRWRLVVASVRVRDTGTGEVYPLAYRLEVVRRDRWYVAAVAGGPSA